MTLRQQVIGRIPPLARRDEELRRRARQIRDLRREQAQAERDLAEERARGEQLVDPSEFAARPSFVRDLVALRRITVQLRELDPQRRHPLRHVPFKLRNYEFAASHGIRVPTVLAVWEDPTQLDLSGLPEAFVLKSDGGAGSHGVLPLRRAGEGFELLDGTRRLTEEEVREHFVSRAAAARISGPFFAEEALRQPGGGPIPDDIKIYVTYGQVQQVMLRRMARHGDLKAATYRYLRADGSDLGPVGLGQAPGPDIPVPDTLTDLVEVARHVSLALGLAFCRVDLFDTDGGVVLGEVTRTPGGRQRYRDDHDEAMGLGWELAQSRLELDLMAGRPPGLLHGEHPAPRLYPETHVSRSADPGAWAPRVVPCSAWCGTT